MRLRGNCSVCRYRVDLRKDGAVGRHSLFYGSDVRRVCSGSGKEPLFAAENRAAKEQHPRAADKEVGA